MQVNINFVGGDGRGQTPHFVARTKGFAGKAFTYHKTVSLEESNCFPPSFRIKLNEGMSGREKYIRDPVGYERVSRGNFGRKPSESRHKRICRNGKNEPCFIKVTHFEE